MRKLNGGSKRLCWSIIIHPGECETIGPCWVPEWRWWEAQVHGFGTDQQSWSWFCPSIVGKHGTWILNTEQPSSNPDNPFKWFLCMWSELWTHFHSQGPLILEHIQHPQFCRPYPFSFSLSQKQKIRSKENGVIHHTVHHAACIR